MGLLLSSHFHRLLHRLQPPCLSYCLAYSYSVSLFKLAWSWGPILKRTSHTWASLHGSTAASAWLAAGHVSSKYKITMFRSHCSLQAFRSWVAPTWCWTYKLRAVSAQFSSWTFLHQPRLCIFNPSFKTSRSGSRFTTFRSLWFGYQENNYCFRVGTSSAIEISLRHRRNKVVFDSRFTGIVHVLLSLLSSLPIRIFHPTWGIV